MIDLTIVVLSYETRDLLGRCLDSIEAARQAHPDLDCETIVVDNGSRDGSLELVKARGPAIRCLALARNRGFAAAVNAALRIARGRHVVLLNSDVQIDRDAFARGVAILDARPEVAVLGAALRHPDGRAQRSVHAFPGLATEWIPEFVLKRLRPAGFERPRGGSSAGGDLRPVEAVRGAVFFLQGPLLVELGDFDEGYFFFLEETDYCWRARRAGYVVGFSAAVGADHILGASSKRRAPLATRIEFHRSLDRFLRRRRGRVVAFLVRVSRVLRNAVALGVTGPLGVFSRRWRRRNAERWGLVLWHLRGCPDDAGLEGGALVATGPRPGRDPATGWEEGGS